jgi:hypothetical protein
MRKAEELKEAIPPERGTTSALKVFYGGSEAAHGETGVFH